MMEQDDRKGQPPLARGRAPAPVAAPDKPEISAPPPPEVPGEQGTDAAPPSEAP